MKILLFGSQGQLGQDLLRTFPKDWSVVPLTRTEADLTQADSISSVLERTNPNVVVNCAAYNLVDLAEKDPQAAFATNALGVKALAEQCHTRHILLVQISTDYVFGGEANRQTPYTEQDPPSPIGIYGMSKRMGEIYTQRYCPDHHLIVRTCGLYGLHGAGGKGKNFPKIIFEVATTQDPDRLAKPFQVVTDEMGTPTYCADLAWGIVALLLQKSRGIFHVTNSGSCSRWECAQEICRLAEQSGFPVRYPSKTTQAEYGLAARRPAYAVLSNEKFRQQVGTILPDWKDALARYFAALLAPHKEEK
ncbi:MAG: dTDP-4-dehydrorhamnose reductase [Gemmataceae bacterium]|jgi:dTDP-4-dehydrorhamnose reductase|nr:dTDP-4-dehydrorhamnose reductase [Gemmataceae bacterium]